VVQLSEAVIVKTQYCSSLLSPEARPFAEGISLADRQQRHANRLSWDPLLRFLFHLANTCECCLLHRRLIEPAVSHMAYQPSSVSRCVPRHRTVPFRAFAQQRPLLCIPAPRPPAPTPVAIEVSCEVGECKAGEVITIKITMGR
jgi:hypothetical protein